MSLIFQTIGKKVYKGLSYFNSHKRESGSKFCNESLNEKNEYKQASDFYNEKITIVANFLGYH